MFSCFNFLTSQQTDTPVHMAEQCILLSFFSVTFERPYQRGSLWYDPRHCGEQWGEADLLATLPLERPRSLPHPIYHSRHGELILEEI